MNGNSEETPMDVDPKDDMDVESSGGTRSTAKDLAFVASGNSPTTNWGTGISGRGPTANESTGISRNSPTTNWASVVIGNSLTTNEGSVISGISVRANKGTGISGRGPTANESTGISRNSPTTNWGAVSRENSLTANEGSGISGRSPTVNEDVGISGRGPTANEDAGISGRSSSANEDAGISGKGPTANEDALTAIGSNYQTEGAASQEDLYTARGAMRVEVDWPKEIPESKRKVELQKAIQSLLNKLAQKAECNMEDLNNDFAEFWVEPSEVRDQLCQVQQLTFKGQMTANVRFSLAPSAPPMPPQSPVSDQLQNARASEKSFAGEAFKKEERNEGCPWEQEAAGWSKSKALSASSESAAFNQGDAQTARTDLTVPLFQYWHIATACSKEIDQIKRNNRVDIEGQASVSIMAPVQNEGKGAVQVAREEFTSLFQKCAHDISVITVPVASLGQGDMVVMLKDIQTEDSKLVLSVSSKGCQLSGPKDCLDRFQKRWRLESLPQGADVAFQKTLDMDLQDPLEKQGLSMDSFHWDFISKVFGKQVMAIKQKFGVDFAAVPRAGMVNVTAVPAGDPRFFLACHALNALQHLYQKGATALLACPLQDPTHRKVEKIKSTFEKIRRQYPCVAAGEANGPWRLAGLAEHLGPAVDEMESTLGEPVFSKEAKLLLPCPKASPTMSDGASASRVGVAEEERCPICMDAFKDKRELKCKHEFCSECLQSSVKFMGPCCPVCKDVFGRIEGNQPRGDMKFRYVTSSLPGFPGCGTIEIQYSIPGGTQTNKHPNPGRRFHGAQRTAYLPDNTEGREVLKLLERAFDQKLIFTVGTSTTTGATDTVTWNDIHHKTNMHGGPQGFGYPDPNYLKRVKDELKAKGIE